jgi:hypothetical protein
MANPFDGSNTLPIKQSPETFILNGTIWRMVSYGPGASGPEDTGVPAVAEDTHPPKPGAVSSDKLAYIATASPVDSDALLMRSALSVAQYYTNYNKGVFNIYCEKFVTHFSTGQGKPPVHPGSFYGKVDFNDLYENYMKKGIPVPVPVVYPSR